MDDTIVGLFPVGETVVVLVDTCFCPFLSSLMVADVRFQHFLGADRIRVGCRFKTQSALTELASDAQTHDGHVVCCRFSGDRKNRAFHFQHTLEGHLQHPRSGRVTGPTPGIPIVERRSRRRSCCRDVGGGILSRATCTKAFP